MSTLDHTEPSQNGAGDPTEALPIAKPHISVVIPTKNEARNVGFVLRRLPESVDEVVIVDSSVDDTVDVARRIRPDVRVIHQARPGKGAALRAGFAAARGEMIVMIDADGSMDPAEIEQYVDCLRNGYDVAKGSRFIEGAGTDDMEFHRRLGNSTLLWAANKLYGTDFTELCYGFMAFRRGAIRSLHLRTDGFEIETEIVTSAVKAGLAIAEVPSFESERLSGTSNLNTWSDGARVLRTMVAQRFTLPRPAMPTQVVEQPAASL